MSQIQRIGIMIKDMEKKIQETEESIKLVRGPLPDALRAILPMQKDQLAILKLMHVELVART